MGYNSDEIENNKRYEANAIFRYVFCFFFYILKYNSKYKCEINIAIRKIKL